MLFEQKLGAVLQMNETLWIHIIWGSTKFGCNERRFGLSSQIITDLGPNFAAAPRYIQEWEDFKSQHRSTRIIMPQNFWKTLEEGLIEESTYTGWSSNLAQKVMSI